MELGATVCTVSNPSCSTCPVRSVCLAHKLTARSHHKASGVDTTTTDDDDDVKGAKPLPKPLLLPSVSGEAGVPPGRACACTVCEVGDDGMAVVPLAVTEFPRKALKT